MYAMYVYKTTSRFTSECKHKLIKLLAFRSAQRYSPNEKQPISLFAQFWKFSKFKPMKEKTDVTPIIAKEKSDRIAKSEKTFLISFDFLNSFFIAYIISMMRIDFLMANTCVHN